MPARSTASRAEPEKASRMAKQKGPDRLAQAATPRLSHRDARRDATSSAEPSSSGRPQMATCKPSC